MIDAEKIINNNFLLTLLMSSLNRIIINKAQKSIAVFTRVRVAVRKKHDCDMKKIDAKKA